MTFTKGTAKAEEVANSNRSSGYHRVRTAVMKDGEGPWYYRVLIPLDAMPSADTHMFAETKPQPAEYKGSNWQKKMPAVCQNDRGFRVIGPDGNPTDAYEDGYGECYIHARDRGKPRDGNFKGDKSTPDWQTYALAVVREPVLDPNTKRPVAYKDATEEFKEKDGTVRVIPRFVIISQKHYNFWSGVEAVTFEVDSLCDQDIRVSRKGTDYNFALCKADPSLRPGTEAWGRYTSALELIGFDLEAHLLELASPDWYARWFIEGAVPEGGYGRSGDDQDDEAAADGEAAVSTVDDARVAALREELRTGRK